MLGRWVSCAGHCFLLILVHNVYTKLWWSVQHRFPEGEGYKCCSKASHPVISASLHLSFPREHQPFKGPQVPQPCQGGIPAPLQGQLLHTAQLLHHKLWLMLKSLILFQSCLLCQNMEQLRGTENTSAEPAWKPARKSVGQHSWVFLGRGLGILQHRL